MAPAATHCIRAGTTSSNFSHDVRGDFGYVGTLESVISWSTSSTRTFRCTYTQGLERQCIAFGAFPPAGVSFRQDCYSFMPGTADNAAGVGDPRDPGSNGIEGGTGTWTCSVT